jgi:hypothetical protein
VLSSSRHGVPHPSDERMGRLMKYHHDRLQAREPKSTAVDTGAADRTGTTFLPTALPELLDRDGSPQDFEQARCTPRETARQGSQRRT